MREELKQFREAMKKRGVTVYYQPYSDAHGSEDISARDQSVRKISGFTGDSCTLVVLEKRAFRAPRRLPLISKRSARRAARSLFMRRCSELRPARS